MLVGKFNHTLDAKKRLFIPAKHREQLGSVFMITRGVDGCLVVYSMEEWNKYSEKLNSLPKTQAREIKRFLYSNAIEAVPDSQGRVLISNELLDYAKIVRDVTILGCDDYSEIWATEKLGETDVEKIEQKMIDLDF